MKRTTLGLLALATTPLALSFEPAKLISNGGFEFTPTVDLTLRYDQKGDTDEVTRLMVSPAVAFALPGSASEFSGNLGSNLGLDYSQQATSFIDLFVDGKLRLEHSQSLASEFSVGAVHGHTNETVSGDDGDYGYQLRTQAEAALLVGDQNSLLQLGLRAGIENQAFTNYRTEFEDKDAIALLLSSQASYLWGSMTRLLVDGRGKHSQYNNDSSADNLEYALLAGLGWSELANTRGALRLGYKGTEYSEDADQSYGGLAYELDSLWQATSYLALGLDSDSKMTNDKNRATQVDFTGQFAANERLGFGLGLGYLNNCSETNEGQLKLSSQYDVRRFVRLGLSYGLTLPEEGTQSQRIEFKMQAGL